MKNEIRRKMKLQRSGLTETDRQAASVRACEIFLDSELYGESECIMLYMPIRNEVDTRYIIERALADGKRVVLPHTDRDTAAITPYALRGNTALSLGAFSIPEPCDTESVQSEDIDLVIVPGLAYDIHGARVGFGKGCYDRFLAGIRAVKVGLCYGFQLVDSLPSDERDIPMDYILTERGLFRCKNT